MIRVGGPQGGTVGLLPLDRDSQSATAEQRAGIHIELSTDDLDALYKELTARGVELFEPPHDEPWERSMRAYETDATRWNSPKAAAGTAVRSGREAARVASSSLVSRGG